MEKDEEKKPYTDPMVYADEVVLNLVDFKAKAQGYLNARIEELGYDLTKKTEIIRVGNSDKVLGKALKDLGQLEALFAFADSMGVELSEEVEHIKEITGFVRWL